MSILPYVIIVLLVSGITILIARKFSPNNNASSNERVRINSPHNTQTSLNEFITENVERSGIENEVADMLVIDEVMSCLNIL